MIKPGAHSSLFCMQLNRRNRKKAMPVMTPPVFFREQMLTSVVSVSEDLKDSQEQVDEIQI